MGFFDLLAYPQHSILDLVHAKHPLTVERMNDIKRRTGMELTPTEHIQTYLVLLCFTLLCFMGTAVFIS